MRIPQKSDGESERGTLVENSIDTKLTDSRVVPISKNRNPQLQSFQSEFLERVQTTRNNPIKKPEFFNFKTEPSEEPQSPWSRPKPPVSRIKDHPLNYLLNLRNSPKDFRFHLHL